MQDIEQERSAGSVQTMSAIFGMLGLKLSVARTVQSGTGESGGDGRLDKDKTGEAAG
jgi:hypothetical protein